MPTDRAPLFPSWLTSRTLGLRAASLVLLAPWCAFGHSAWGQGGGNANAVGISLENSANAAAARSDANAAGAGNPSTGIPSASSPAASNPGPAYPGGGSASAGYPGGGASGPGYPGSGASSPGYPGASPGYASPGYPGASGVPSSGYGANGSGTSLDYNMEPSGPGYGGAPRGGGALALGSGMLAGSLAEFFNRPLPESALRYQPSLLEQGTLALYQGNQRAGLALFHAHLIAERDSASSSLNDVAFSPLLRRPVWALRLAVSLNAKVPATLEDGPQPIREGDKPATGRRAGTPYASGDSYSSGAELASPESAAGSSAPGGSAEGLNASAALGMSSEIYSGDPGGAAAPGMQSGANGLATGPYGAGGVAGGAVSMPALPSTPGGDRTVAAQEELDRYLGIVAEIMNTELTQRLRAGTFGMLWRELPAQGTALVEKLAGAGMSINVPASGQVPMWIPGVDYLGMIHPAQVLEKAKENEIDVLLHFEVGMKENRGTEPQYVVRCRVINVASGETLGASKMMDKRDVLLAARRSDVKTVVKGMLSPALEALDSKAAVQPMPQLAPQHAVSRIDALLASPGGVRMKHLAEISMFHARGLIDENQFDQAVFYAIAEDGLRLLYGDEEQRTELAARLVGSELDKQ